MIHSMKLNMVNLSESLNGCVVFSGSNVKENIVKLGLVDGY